MTHTPPEIVFLLVEPARGENVGAAARALKTMGFRHLWLVNACPLDREARWVAHESHDILDNARHFSALGDALAEVDFSIATTARRRLQRNDYLDAGEIRPAIFDKGDTVRRAALVFGREASGLTGEEIRCCDAASCLPIACSQPSLNLGQAVMLYAWQLAAWHDADDPRPPVSGTGKSLPVIRRTLLNRLEELGIGADENLYQWAGEGLARFSARDLGMLMQILKRL